MRVLEKISVLILFSALVVRQSCGVESADTKLLSPPKMQLSDAITDSNEYNHFVFLEQRTDNTGALVRAFVLAQVEPTGFSLRDIYTATGEEKDLAGRWGNIRLLCVSRGQLYLNRSRDLLSIDLSTGQYRRVASDVFRAQDWYDDGRLYTLGQAGVVRVYDLRIGASRTITSLPRSRYPQTGMLEIHVSPDHTKLVFFEEVGQVWFGGCRYRLNVLGLRSNKHTQPLDIMYIHHPIPGGSHPPPPLLWLDEQNLLFVRAQLPAGSFPRGSLLDQFLRARNPKEFFLYLKMRSQYRPSDFYKVQGPSGGTATGGLGIRHDLASVNIATGEIKSIAELPNSMVKFHKSVPNASKVRVTSRYDRASMHYCLHLDPDTSQLTNDDTCVGAFRLRGENFDHTYQDHYALEIFHGDRPLCTDRARQGLLISICPAGNRVIWSPIRDNLVCYYDQEEQQVRPMSSKSPRDQHFLWIADKDLTRTDRSEQIPPGWTPFGQTNPAHNTP